MTAAMQNIGNILGSVKMTERDTIGVVSKRNQVYRLLSVFQCLLMMPLFGVKKISGVDCSGIPWHLSCPHTRILSIGSLPIPM